MSRNNTNPLHFLTPGRLQATMSLQELRESLRIHQQELANRLGIKQAAVSRMEHRTDLQISHLRRVVEAMGGKLVITACFPSIDVHLDS